MNDKNSSAPSDTQLYQQARAHMEKWSGAASLARTLWDAVVREHDRLERELKMFQALCVNGVKREKQLAARVMEMAEEITRLREVSGKERA